MGSFGQEYFFLESLFTSLSNEVQYRSNVSSQSRLENSILDPLSFRESSIEFRGSRIEFRGSSDSNNFSSDLNRDFEETIYFSKLDNNIETIAISCGFFLFTQVYFVLTSSGGKLKRKLTYIRRKV